MPSLGNNDVRLKVSTSADTKGIDDTSASLNRLSGDAEHTSHATELIGSAGRIAVGGLAILGTALAGVSVAAIKATGDFESNRVAFDVMLGSADKASQLMTQISAFAKTTPFELPDVVSGAKKLLAYGFAQDQILGTMKSLGDVSAGVGVNFGELVDIYGKARTQGTLFTEDFDQFTGRGIPLAKALSKELGVPAEKVRGLASDGKITFDVLEKGFKEMTKDGSQFGGMMDKQSQTFNGVMSNLSDGFQGVLRHAAGMDDAGNIIKGGFFDRVKNAATGFMPVLQGISDNVGGVMTFVLDSFDKGTAGVKAMFKAFSDGKADGDGFTGFMQNLGIAFRQAWDYVSPKITELWKNIQQNLFPVLLRLWNEVILPLIPVLGVTLVAAFGAVVDILNFLLPILTALTNWGIDNVPIILGVVGAFVALKAALAIQEAIGAFKSGMADGMKSANDSIDGTNNKVGGLSGNLAKFAGWAAFAGLAITAFTTVISGINNISGYVDGLNANLNDSNKKTDDLYQKWKDGKISKDEYVKGLQEASKVSKQTADDAQYVIDRYKGLGGFFNYVGDVVSGNKPQKRAAGGPVTAGKPYIVGDNPDGSLNSTSELFVPSQSGTIVNSRDLQSGMGGGGSSISITIHNLAVNGDNSFENYIKSLDQDSFNTSRGITPNRGRM